MKFSNDSLLTKGIFSEIYSLKYDPVDYKFKKRNIILSLINQSLDNVPTKNLEMTLKQLSVAGSRHSDIALMYEFSENIKPYLNKIEEIAKKNSMYIIVAGPYGSKRNVDAFLIDRNGLIVFRYHKITQNEYAASILQFVVGENKKIKKCWAYVSHSALLLSDSGRFV